MNRATGVGKCTAPAQPQPVGRSRGTTTYSNNRSGSGPLTREGKMGMRIATLATALAASAGVPATLHGQSLENAAATASRGGRAFTPTLEARRITAAAPTIDGILDEPDWAAAMAARNFIVFEPNEGAAAAQSTEARALYGDDAIYVGIRAFDSAPDSIVARLARRDERPHSDWLDVVIDSYHDRRTAFRFGVNPAGVKSDGYMYDDVEEDDSWDAVWDVATRTDDGGWTAEFRIPYSQLRFDDAAVQTWGINFARFIGRHLERSLWAPISRGDGALVSRFGDLSGLHDLSPPARLGRCCPTAWRGCGEPPATPTTPSTTRTTWRARSGPTSSMGSPPTSPWTSPSTRTSDRLKRTPRRSTSPRSRRSCPSGGRSSSKAPTSSPSGSLGGRRRHGQRGAVLLAAHREGASGTRGFAVFGFSAADAHSGRDEALPGRTRSGWNDRPAPPLTGREAALLADASGPAGEQVVEPLAQYGMGRVSRDFREGRSAVGVISTWTARDAAAAEALALHAGAYTAGFDARHRFGEDRFIVSGYLMGSTVRGSAGAISRTQRSLARYFQRPDADHTEFDPARTSLEGWAGSASFAKISGGYWRYGTGFVARSPGFDSNDLGFMRETDFVVPWAWAGYDRYRPSGPFQR